MRVFACRACAMDRIPLPSPLSHSLASHRVRLGPWLPPPVRQTIAATVNGVNGANRVSQVSRNSDGNTLIPSRFFTSLSSRPSFCAKTCVFLRQSACASPRSSSCLSASPSAGIWTSASGAYPCAHPLREGLSRTGAPKGGAGRIGAQLAGLQSRAALPLVARAEGGEEAGVIVARGRRYSGTGKGGEEEGEEEEDGEEGDEGREMAAMHAGEEDELDKGGGSSSEGEESGGGEANGGRKKRRRRREEEKQRTREGAEASSGESLRRGVTYAEAERWVGGGAEAEAADVVGAFEGVRLTTLVDGTLGAGGHTLALARHHPELQAVVGMDVDPSAHAIAAARLHPFMRIAAPPGARAGSPHDAHAHTQAAAPVEEWGEAEERGQSEEQAQATVRVAEEPEATLRVSEERGATATLHVVEGNFRRMVEACAGVGVARGSVDGILLDVGVSSMQIDRAERGFSFMRDGPLDMRMDPKSPITAEVAVNDWPEEVLGKILRDLGEERRWRQLARRIVEARGRGRISSTTQLAAVVAGGAYGPEGLSHSCRSHPHPPVPVAPGVRPPIHPHLPAHPLHTISSPIPPLPLHILSCPVCPISASSSRRGGPGMRIHPATRTFQALRIAVNDELAALALAIPAALSLLAPGGRLAVISFHSLEDRIVKRSFLEAAAGMAVPMPVPVPLPVPVPVPVSAPQVGSSSGWEGHGHARYRVVTKRPVVAEEDEWRVNARSRSAKLRVIERVA
ncbi:unnamed protein product [Closterium sp. Naga37s-1]|nr:unnamed protein product [Closterium sp. Naga37s-1]